MLKYNKISLQKFYTISLNPHRDSYLPNLPFMVTFKLSFLFSLLYLPCSVLLSLNLFYTELQIWFIPCFLGSSNGKESVCNVGDQGLIPGSGRSSGEGHGKPLQDSCLENPMDRGAWWATVHGVAKSQT